MINILFLHTQGYSQCKFLSIRWNRDYTDLYFPRQGCSWFWQIRVRSWYSHSVIFHKYHRNRAATTQVKYERGIDKITRFWECWSKKTSKVRVTGLCERNSTGTGEFPAQMTSCVENDVIMIWQLYQYNGDNYNRQKHVNEHLAVG